MKINEILLEALKPTADELYKDIAVKKKAAEDAKQAYKASTNVSRPGGFLGQMSDIANTKQDATSSSYTAYKSDRGSQEQAKQALELAVDQYEQSIKKYQEHMKQQPQDQQEPATDTSTDTQQPDTDAQQPDTSTDTQQPEQPDLRPDPVDTEAEKANANIKSKIDYLVKKGVLQSGRITDTERQYIDSVDVYVDPNKFARAEPSQIILKARPPHVSNYSTSVSMPLSAWQEALGRDGSGLRGNVGFNLTPAGWWSDDYKAYVNPRNKLDDLITSYQK
jgi:hypothetical protein